MNMILITLGITLITITLVLVGLGLRMLVVKDGEFRGGCASNSPWLKNEIGECTVCGASPDEQCKKPESHDDQDSSLKDPS